MVARTTLAVLIVDLDMGGRRGSWYSRRSGERRWREVKAASRRELAGVRPFHSLVSAAEVGGERP